LLEVAMAEKVILQPAETATTVELGDQLVKQDRLAVVEVVAAPLCC
jgi:hypothetical protein